LVFGNIFPSADLLKDIVFQKQCQVYFCFWVSGQFPQFATNFAKRLVFLDFTFETLKKTSIETPYYLSLRKWNLFKCRTI